jgi:hypothetical protein
LHSFVKKAKEILEVNPKDLPTFSITSLECALLCCGVLQQKCPDFHCVEWAMSPIVVNLQLHEFSL